MKHSSLIFYFCLLKFNPSAVLDTMVKKNVLNKKLGPNFQDQVIKIIKYHSFVILYWDINTQRLRSSRITQAGTKIRFFFPWVKTKFFQWKFQLKKELDIRYFWILSTICESPEPKHPKWILESTLFTYLWNGYSDAVFLNFFFKILKQKGVQFPLFPIHTYSLKTNNLFCRKL